VIVSSHWIYVLKLSPLLIHPLVLLLGLDVVMVHVLRELIHVKTWHVPLLYHTDVQMDCVPPMSVDVTLHKLVVHGTDPTSVNLVVNVY